MILTRKEYILIEPYTIKKISNIFSSYENNQVLVKPILAGICGSDLLYFKGQKSPQKFYQRLPLIPLHEGVVQFDNNKYASIIPFKKCNKCYACNIGKENLCENSAYMGSNAPGLACSQFFYPPELIVEIPSSLPLELSILLEPMSIIWRMLDETEVEKDSKIGVIGNGTMGRLTVIFLALFKNIPPSNLFLLGRNSAQLNKFKDICTPLILPTLSLNEWKSKFNLMIEAVGGKAMIYTLSQAIELVIPGGRINIFGLSDDLSHLNFTKIVNKGISLRGFSRACYDDYYKMMQMLKEKRSMQEFLKRVIDEKIFLVEDEIDLMQAYHYAMSNRNQGRVIVRFKE